MDFFMAGPCEDVAYQHTRDDPSGAAHKRFVEELWAKFYPLADPHFREDARNHFLERFWEMYLAVALIEQGFPLHRHGERGPKFYALIGNRRVWFEPVAPSLGTTADQVPKPVTGAAAYLSDMKTILRLTNAFGTKRRVYAAALDKGIISPNDAYVLAINTRDNTPNVAYRNSMPFFIEAFLPLSSGTFILDEKAIVMRDSYYQYRPYVTKLSGTCSFTLTFLNDEASFCSAILHSTVDWANHPAQLGGEFEVLHNHRAMRPLDAAVFSWCQQYTCRDGQLHRSEPLPR